MNKVKGKRIIVAFQADGELNDALEKYAKTIDRTKSDAIRVILKKEVFRK